MRYKALCLVLAVLAGLTILAMPASAVACGDGEPDVGEQCDDANTQGGDGCSATCQIEAGSDCTAAIASIPGDPPTDPVYSRCLVGGCGDSIESDGESCDDGNAAPGDGCDAACQTEPGFTCTPATSASLPV